MQIEYAEVCSKIAGIIWSRNVTPQGSPHQQRIPAMEAVHSLYKWHERLPGLSKWTTDEALDGKVLDGQSLIAFCQLHSAIMSLDKFTLPCEGNSDCVSPTASATPSAQSARAVLTASLYMPELASYCTT